MDEFNGPELVAGTVKGIRTFNVKKSRLYSLMATDYRYKSGENRARCNMGSLWDMRIDHSKEHTPGQKDCSCGFYAYHTGADNEYSRGTRVRAIVEGYGRVTMGDKGWRAEKLRILYLINPLGAQLLLVSLFLPLITFTLLSVFVSEIFIIFSTLPYTLGAATLVTIDSRRPYNRRIENSVNLTGLYVGPFRFREMRLNYPDAKVRFRWQTRKLVPTVGKKSGS